MRYLVGLLCVCALMGTLPQSASAQAGQEGTEPSVEEPAPEPEEPEPSAEAAAEEPALQLELDDAGAEVVEMQRRVRNAKIGLGISGVSVLVGGVLLGIGLGGVYQDIGTPEEAAGNDRVAFAGATLLTGGVASLLATGILLGVRKGKLESHERRLRKLQRDLPLGGGGARPQARRVQWDLAGSRLVF